MKMKQISDTTLKITMTLDDLMDREWRLQTFVPQEKPKSFFYAILDELEMPDNFLIVAC